MAINGDHISPHQLVQVLNATLSVQTNERQAAEEQLQTWSRLPSSLLLCLLQFLAAPSAQFGVEDALRVQASISIKHLIDRNWRKSVSTCIKIS